jgi:transposase InsO family protein
MREHGLQAPQRVGHPRGPKAHDGTIITDLPDEMWGTDMTTTVTTGEGHVCVFVAVDHCTSECVGIHASRSGNRFEALEPLRQGVREQFGAFEKAIASGLAIRHDHGSAYMSDDFQQELSFLGMTSGLSQLDFGAPGASFGPECSAIVRCRTPILSSDRPLARRVSSGSRRAMVSPNDLSGR